MRECHVGATITAQSHKQSSSTFLRQRHCTPLTLLLLPAFPPLTPLRLPSSPVLSLPSSSSRPGPAAAAAAAAAAGCCQMGGYQTGGCQMGGCAAQMQRWPLPHSTSWAWIAPGWMGGEGRGEGGREEEMTGANKGGKDKEEGEQRRVAGNTQCPAQILLSSTRRSCRTRELLLTAAPFSSHPSPPRSHLPSLLSPRSGCC